MQDGVPLQTSDLIRKYLNDKRSPGGVLVYDENLPGKFQQISRTNRGRKGENSPFWREIPYN